MCSQIYQTFLTARIGNHENPTRESRVGHHFKDSYPYEAIRNPIDALLTDDILPVRINREPLNFASDKAVKFCLKDSMDQRALSTICFLLSAIERP